jgi:hypothetical protein
VYGLTYFLGFQTIIMMILAIEDLGLGLKLCHHHVQSQIECLWYDHVACGDMLQGRDAGVISNPLERLRKGPERQVLNNTTGISDSVSYCMFTIGGDLLVFEGEGDNPRNGDAVR